MFSDEEVAQAVAAAVGAGRREIDLGVVDAIMKETAAMLAARSGILTVEQVAAMWQRVARGDQFGNVRVRELLDSHAAQGARIAVLEQSNERATTILVEIGALVGQREGEPTADAVRRALEESRRDARAASSAMNECAHQRDMSDARAEVAEAMLKERETLLSGANERAETLGQGFRQALAERDAALADRDKHATTSEVWRKRVDGAADALADVLPGEMGRLNLVARIAELKRQMDDALARLKPSGDAVGVERQVETLSRRLCRSVADEIDTALFAYLQNPEPPAHHILTAVRAAERAIRAVLRSSAADALSASIEKAHGYAAAVADNAALLAIMRDARAALHDGGAWGEDRRIKMLVALADSTTHHPGAALLEEMETLRQRQVLWEDAAHTLYGYGVFIGPCVHGRDPWDRCDECGEESAVHALVKVVAKKDKEHRKALVRARNEGLEKAAATFDCNECFGKCSSKACAERLRALKDPEPTCTDGSCAKCRSGEPCH